jgi:hypothetical protein
VLTTEIDTFREALQNLADQISFHKRGLCVDAIVVFSKDCSKITISLAHLEALLVEQHADIDLGAVVLYLSDFASVRKPKAQSLGLACGFKSAWHAATAS